MCDGVCDSDCEGAGEMFRLSPVGKEEFFDEPAYLTVSGQLQGMTGVVLLLPLLPLLPQCHCCCYIATTGAAIMPLCCCYSATAVTVPLLPLCCCYSATAVTVPLLSKCHCCRSQVLILR